MSKQTEEKKDLSEYLLDFFAKTDLGYYEASSKMNIKFELCLDLDCNIVPESKNKVTIDYSF